MTRIVGPDRLTDLLWNNSKPVNNNHVAIEKPSYSKSSIKLWNGMTWHVLLLYRLLFLFWYIYFCFFRELDKLELSEN